MPRSGLATPGGRFDLAQVASGIATKLVRRHPHVFGDRSAEDVDEALSSWNEAKHAEGKADRTSVLDGVPSDLPWARRRIGSKACSKMR